MRTTVTLDDDTEQIVRARMKAKGVSFKRALNDSIRDGSSKRRERTESFHTPVFDMGIPSVDLTKANQLAADLEDDELIRRLRGA